MVEPTCFVPLSKHHEAQHLTNWGRDADAGRPHWPVVARSTRAGGYPHRERSRPDDPVLRAASDGRPIRQLAAPVTVLEKYEIIESTRVKVG